MKITLFLTASFAGYSRSLKLLISLQIKSMISCENLTSVFSLCLNLVMGRAEISFRDVQEEGLITRSTYVKIYNVFFLPSVSES